MPRFAFLLLIAAPAVFAASPDAGTLSGASPSITYSAGPFAVPNSSLNDDANHPDCTAPANPCDDFALTVDVPPDYAITHPRDLIRVVAQWAVNNDAFFLYLLDAQGNVLLSSQSGNDPNSLSYPAAPGTYTVRLVPSNAGGDLVTASVTLVSDETAPATDAPPAFAALQPLPGVGDNTNGEMSIGHNPKTRRTLTLGFSQTLRTTYAGDGTPSWEDVSEPNTQLNSNDPILFTDPRTGRSFVSQLQAGTPGESIFYFTDDDGDSWTLSPSTADGGIDHQTVGGGPYPAGGTAGPAGDYADAVYYCSQSVLLAFCIRSDDGGMTFGAPAVLKTDADCDGYLGAIHGHLKVAADGTVYVPDRSCGGRQALAVSTDAGETFTLKRLPEGATAGEGDPSVGVGSDGTLYFCYLRADSHVHVAVSHDRGDTWINDHDVGYAAGVVHAVFPAAVAGDADRAACAFLGTGTRGAYQSTSFEGIWFPYVAMTYDGGQTWHTVNGTPGDPVQGTGGIALGGTTAIENRNLLDFNDITLDEHGRVLFAYDDGCLGDCVLPPYQPAQVCIPTGGINDVCINSTAKSTILRQRGGRTLYAAFDGSGASGGGGGDGPLPEGHRLFGALAPGLLVTLALAGVLRRRRR
ncbi:MAG TPA: exo-alpha-sialidase [Candidatus Binatia bacterium]|nr:exo-alpha-sialidase [Candidatus Binatia bacterium]